MLAMLVTQGTMRMEADDDGSSSVCDFQIPCLGWQNLFVCGNAATPTAIACNPTLTTVALAVRSAGHVISLLATNAQEAAP